MNKWKLTFEQGFAAYKAFLSIVSDILINPIF